MLKSVFFKPILIVSLFFVNQGFSQSPFQEFEGSSKIAVVEINEDMFYLMSQFASVSDEVKEYKNLISGLEYMKVLTTHTSSEVDRLKTATKNYSDEQNLERLMKVKEDDVFVEVYAKEGESDNKVRELLLFVDQISINPENDLAESAVLLVQGDIDMLKIAEIINSLNIDGAEYLKLIQN